LLFFSPPLFASLPGGLRETGFTRCLSPLPYKSDPECTIIQMKPMSLVPPFCAAKCSSSPPICPSGQLFRVTNKNHSPFPPPPTAPLRIQPPRESGSAAMPISSSLPHPGPAECRLHLVPTRITQVRFLGESRHK